MCHFVYSAQTLHNLVHIFEHVLKYQFAAVSNQQRPCHTYKAVNTDMTVPKQDILYMTLCRPFLIKGIRATGQQAIGSTLHYTIHYTIQGVDKADLWLPINRSIVPLPPTCEFCEWVLARSSDPGNQCSMWAKLIADKKDLIYYNVY